jgi:hypothetical protein
MYALIDVEPDIFQIVFDIVIPLLSFHLTSIVACCCYLSLRLKCIRSTPRCR